MEELYNADGWRIIVETAMLPDGRATKRSRVERADSVHVLAFPKPDQLLIIREYRPYYSAYIWMLPSGKMDKEKNMQVAAQRELQEETGYRAESLEHWCTTNHSESFIMANYIFIARDLVKDPLPQDADEMIEVHVFPLEEALQKILSSPKVHTVSAFAVLRYMHDKKK